MWLSRSAQQDGSLAYLGECWGLWREMTTQMCAVSILVIFIYSYISEHTLPGAAIQWATSQNSADVSRIVLGLGTR